MGAPAPTAEALMRSRYTAYARGLVDYILATTDPLGPLFQSDEAAWREEVARFSAGTRFVSLKVESHEPGEEVAYVTFTAQLETAGGPVVRAERSRFVRKGGRWFYHSGE